MNIEQARFNMIEQQIRPWDVLNMGVLELLAIVRREDFVPPAHRALAFADTEVPLTGGQSMLSPKVEARLLQELDVRRHERVLEIGAGSGYMAALLAHRAQHVTTLEIDAGLADFAAANLKRAGVMNATVARADGARGYAAEAPFDVILLSGSVAAVPEALLAQLKPGGRLAGIVGQEPAMRAELIRRGSGEGTERIALFETFAPRLQGFGEPTRFHFDVKQITGAELRAMAQRDAAPPVLLDVREPWEFALARIEVDGLETRHIPMNEIPGRLASLDPAQRVVCVCHHGVRSAHVVSFLERQGFDDAWNLVGGIDAWSAEVDPGVPRY